MTDNEIVLDPDEKVFENPESEKPPVTLPSGTYGHDGMAEIVHCKLDARQGNDGEIIKFLNCLVAVQHPELGRCLVGTSPFGGPGKNTSTKPNSGSLFNVFVRQLGLGGMTSAQMEQATKGRKVILSVKTREGKKAADGTVPVYADITGIWNRDDAQAAGQ
jgi:hypothetical protein